MPVPNSKTEWLETSSTGDSPMGTAAGINTRRYHALLVASLRPPVERYVLLSNIEEEVNGVQLGAAQYPGVVTPQGYEFIERFQSDPCATWTYRAGGLLIHKQVYMIENRQAVVIRYRADQAVTLRARPFLAYRDYHSLGSRRDDVTRRTPAHRIQTRRPFRIGTGLVLQQRISGRTRPRSRFSGRPLHPWSNRARPETKRVVRNLCHHRRRRLRRSLRVPIRS